MTAPPCLHCGNASILVNGTEVYPHRPDLAAKKFWVCRPCQASCGCHGGTEKPLGYPANKPTRWARLKLHHEKLDPLWKAQPKEKRKSARVAVYKHLSSTMGLEPKQTHTGMFTIEQCRAAWRALDSFAYEDQP